MSSYALPELKSRLRIDTSGVRSDVAPVHEQVAALGRASETAGEGGAFRHLMTALATVKEQTNAVIERVAVLGETASKLGGAAGIEGGGGVFGSIGGALGALGPLAALGGIAALGAGLEHLVTQTANYSSAVLRNSELLGLNTEQYQGLYQASKQFGIEHEDLTRTLINFQRQISEGAPMLKRLGLDLGDVGITSNDTGTAINQLSAFLHDNTNEAQRNAVGIALLGRNGVALTEILSKGPEFLAAYTAEMKQFGLILDDNALRTGAAAKAIHDQMSLALQGVEMQIGTRLEGAFSALWLTIMGGAQSSKQAINSISDAIAGVVGALASFLQGLFGLSIDFQSLNEHLHDPVSTLAGAAQTAQDAGSSFDGLSGSVDASKAALDALRESTRHATESLDDQIKALQDQQSALDQATTDEITTIQRREQAVQDQITDQRDLQAQQDATHQSYLSQLQDQLNALTHTQDDRRRSGESLIDYERRLQEQDLKDKITQEQDRRQVVKTTQDLQLQQLKEQDQAETNHLKDEQERAKKLTDAQVTQLNARKTALQRHLQDEEAANQAANSKVAAGYAGLSNNITGSMGTAGTNVKGVFDQMQIHANEKAQEIGQNIRDIFKHPENFLADAIKLGTIIGEAIGGAILGGLARKVGDTLMPWVTDPQHVTPWNPQGAGGGSDIYIDPNTHKSYTGTYTPDSGQKSGWDFQVDGGALIKNVPNPAPGRAAGGPVLAGARALSQASSVLDVYMVGENGPEPAVFSRNGYVVSREDALARLGSLQSSSGSEATIVNFNAPVADYLVARRVVDEIRSEQRRRAMSVAGRSG